MTGDVSVVGLKPDTCVLGDIGMDVPHGRVVVVPADKALRSKDLYRSINQGYLFRLQAGPPPALSMNPLLPEVQSLRDRVQQLEEENRALREKLVRAEARVPQDSKLDAILHLLQASPGAATRSDTLPSPALTEVVDFAAPTFIPSKIRPDDMQAHIQTETSTASGGDVSGAAARLRELRRGQQ
jgi:hypothetical protein